MCAQFTLKTNKSALTNLGISLPESFTEIDERVLPSKVAPVIVQTQNLLKLTGMKFSLIPSWSSEPKVKFVTHNARIETVLEKPTWRIPFEKMHCIIPMTGFFESVYEGPLAGNIIKFEKKDSDLLFAAGIFDQWKNPNNPNDNFFSFSILTTEPTKFISDNGHDRSPLFLDFESAKSWLKLSGHPKSQVDFLLSQNLKPSLSVSVDRPLKEGWEKRK